MVGKGNFLGRGEGSRQRAYFEVPELVEWMHFLKLKKQLPKQRKTVEIWGDS